MSIQLNLVLRHIRKLAGDGKATDQQLLHRFANQHEEAAFEMLVERHGPAVLGLCRRVLRHEQDAEDVFQATFLTLARKASSIRKPESLSCWLYGVASRLAFKVRGSAAKRHTAETIRRPIEPSVGQELCAALDEELSRLAWRYRAPIVLCYLQGKTRDEAARQLGWSLGTLKLRLTQGREILRQRLTRRGLTLSAVLTAVGLSHETVPAALVISTSRAAMHFAAGSSAGIAAKLAEGALQGMVLSKLKIGATLVLAVSVVGVGAGLIAHQVQRVKPAPASGVANPEKLVAQQKALTDRYGDPLPPGAIARFGTVRFRHGGSVRAVAFLPDGKTLASKGGYGEEVVRLWELSTGRELLHFELGRGFDIPVRFSPDVKLLASAGSDGTVRLWDLATGKTLRQFGSGAIPATSRTRGGFVAFSFSDDGRMLASMSPDATALSLWEVATGREIRSFPISGQREAVDSVVFSPGGKALATAHADGKTCLWETATGKRIMVLEGKRWVGPAFSPDGRIIATVGGDELTIHISEVMTGRAIHALQGHHTTVSSPEKVISSLTFAPDGKTLASSGIPGDISLWEVTSGKELRILRGHQKQLNSLSFSSDSRILISVSMDEGMICLWDVATGTQIRQIPMGSQPMGFHCVLSPDGKTLALGSSHHTVRLWDVLTGNELPRLVGHQGMIYTAAIAPDGRTVATGGGDQTIRVWDVATQREIYRLVGHDSEVKTVAFAGEGRTLVSIGWNDNTVHVWDTATGKELRRIKGDENRIQCLELSPDGELVAWGCQDSTIQLVAVSSGKELVRLGTAKATAQKDGIKITAFSPDGKKFAILGWDGDKTIHLWNVVTGKELPHLVGPARDCNALAFSPDGKTLASGSWVANTIQLWEVATGSERLQFPTPEGLLVKVAFSPDGKTLVSAANDGTVRLWRADIGKEVNRFAGHQRSVWAIRFFPDGRTMLTAGNDTTALIWKVASAVQTQPLPIQAGDLEGLWPALASTDGSEAYRAICALSTAGKQAVPCLERRLRPAARPDAKQLRQLIVDLDSDRFATRDLASRELAKLGEVAETAVRKAQAGETSFEVRRRLKQLLEQLDGPIIWPERLQELRAIEVLEHIGTAEARQVLQTLANGAPEARITQEAKASLERLAKRP